MDIKTGHKMLLASFLFVACLMAATTSHAVITSASFSNDIAFETLGASSTVITYNVSVNSNIEIDIYRLKDVSDTPALVAKLPQTGVLMGSHSVTWDGFWPVGGVLGRQDGLYKIVVVDLDTSATFAISNYLNITSVDIHSVDIGPSHDADQNPVLPYRITYALAKDSLVSVGIFDFSGNLIRTLIANAPQYGENVKPTNTILWNGLDANGKPAPLDVYTVVIGAIDPVYADRAIQRQGPATIQSLASLDSDAKQTFERNAFVFPNPIRSGNAATACGTPACFQFLAVRANAKISLKIYTIDGTLVRSENFTGLTTGNVVPFNWDATNDSGKALGRGLYYYVVREEDEVGTLQTIKKMAIIK